LTFDFDAVEVALNTADAYRLVLWTQDRDAGEGMAERLFEACFHRGGERLRRGIGVDGWRRTAS